MIKKLIFKLFWKFGLYFVGLLLMRALFRDYFQKLFVQLFIDYYGLFPHEEVMQYEVLCIFSINFIFYITVLRRLIPKYFFRLNLRGELVLFFIFNALIFFALFVKVYR